MFEGHPASLWACSCTTMNHPLKDEILWFHTLRTTRAIRAIRPTHAMLYARYDLRALYSTRTILYARYALQSLGLAQAMLHGRYALHVLRSTCVCSCTSMNQPLRIEIHWLHTDVYCCNTCPSAFMSNLTTLWTRLCLFLVLLNPRLLT